MIVERPPRPCLRRTRQHAGCGSLHSLPLLDNQLASLASLNPCVVPARQALSLISVAILSGVGLLVSLSILLLDGNIPGDWF